jgi:hypothetical protein
MRLLGFAHDAVQKSLASDRRPVIITTVPRQNALTTTAPPDTPSDPARSTVPERIGALLRVARVLLGYGRHLAGTVRYRAAAPGFTTIAACFGTADLATIRAHLQRGILRALALERVLLARAARGHDIDFAHCRRRTPDSQPPPTVAAVDQQAASAAPRPAALRRAAALAPRPALDDPADVGIPTLRQLQAQVRRRPLGRTIVDICLDLAVVPGLCTGTFWNELFDLIRCHGGSIATLVRERWRREQAFHAQQDRHPAPGRNWWNPSRATMRQVLGFFIGEAPLAPSATGPP